jgi:CheY-like chemotaxis protein
MACPRLLLDSEPRLEGVLVLVVDDALDVREVVTEVLTGLGGLAVDDQLELRRLLDR